MIGAPTFSSITFSEWPQLESNHEIDISSSTEEKVSIEEPRHF